MGFRYYKRINMGKGFGSNVSKSGIRPSYRSKSGSVNSKGFSVRTGIPGLTYRKSFSKAKNGGCLVTLLIALNVALFFSFLGCTEEENTEIETQVLTNCGTHNGNKLNLGPRGGCYYFNSNNNKIYVDRSECKC